MGGHRKGLSMQRASSQAGDVCIFNREDVVQTSEREETGPGVEASLSLISKSSNPIFAAF